MINVLLYGNPIQLHVSCDYKTNTLRVLTDECIIVQVFFYSMKHVND